MAALLFSRRAESDLMNIGVYTLRTWGRAQTVRYLSDLELCCQRLAANPSIGRSCDEIRSGLRRLECGAHVLFYRQKRDGILISRILHRSMLPERHSIDEPEVGQ